jgi:preprotein translocase subunit SecG
MLIAILVLIMIVSVLLVLIVLVQNSKGGGLASNFSSSNQYMGVRRTTDFLEKATWTLAIAMVVLTLASVMAISRPGTRGAGTDLQKVTEMPAMPTLPPAATQPEQQQQQQQQPPIEIQMD